jgi:hypothetical protein
LVVGRPDSPRPFPLADDFGVLFGLADFATKIAQQVFVKKDALAGVDGDARIARMPSSFTTNLSKALKTGSRSKKKSRP